jgi:uncharacterized NAD-dependent epimerase/dehydratase family protein
MIETPYLLFLGDAPDPLAAKVAQGIRDWRPEFAVGQLRLEGCKADMRLPDMTLAEAKAAGAKTVVIGVANRGGVISQAWKKVLVEALEEGFDLASGLHNLLRDEADLVAVARATGRKLHDVRVPSVKYPIANGVKRPASAASPSAPTARSARCTPRSAMEKRDARRGHEGDVPRHRPDRHPDHRRRRAAGCGDRRFHGRLDRMADARQRPRPLGPDRGQGSLFHVSYSGVTLALIHGGQPDALILCHEPTREHMRGLPDYKLPTLEPARHWRWLARVANPACQVVGISVNTAAHERGRRPDYLAEVEARMGLPTVDPFRHGAGRLVDATGRDLRRAMSSPSRPKASAGRGLHHRRGSRTEAKVLTVR